MNITGYIKRLILPKDNIFFNLLEINSENLLEAAQKLITLLGLENPGEQKHLINEIKDIEAKGDEVALRIFQNLNKFYLTPYDRQDIHGLATTLDDVTDHINTAAQRIGLYKPQRVAPEFLKLAKLINEAGKQINLAIKELRQLKSTKKLNEICYKIYSIENQADDIYHFAKSELFDKQRDAIELIKMKEILEALEQTMDHAEDFSNVLKTIIMKNFG